LDTKWAGWQIGWARTGTKPVRIDLLTATIHQPEGAVQHAADEIGLSSATR
jgi:hypothetical protein